ncbi:hypothetical protein K488DRAFT_75107 [Vararia minispora EC-137]|uniref:Uncharacterized protein n=1 Tax=Vararia minispora EC-137 TaxID=1314806 RepID=A0ACB8Q556_9AGAM|nr:hypothetical protein K488DRAFT_75107 [Vararia minispora EC-137]
MSTINTAQRPLSNIIFPENILTHISLADVGAHRFAVLAGYETGVVDKGTSAPRGAQLWVREGTSSPSSPNQCVAFVYWLRKVLNRENHGVLEQALRNDIPIDVSPSPSPPSSLSFRRLRPPSPSLRTETPSNKSFVSNPEPRRFVPRRPATAAPQATAVGNAPPTSSPATSCPSSHPNRAGSGIPRPLPTTPTATPPMLRQGAAGLYIPNDWVPTEFTPPFGADRLWCPAYLPPDSDGRVGLGRVGIHSWYIVWDGLRPGIFNSWQACKESNGENNSAFLCKGHGVYEDALAHWWVKWNKGKSAGGLLFRSRASEQDLVGAACRRREYFELSQNVVGMYARHLPRHVLLNPSPDGLTRRHVGLDGRQRPNVTSFLPRACSDIKKGLTAAERKRRSRFVHRYRRSKLGKGQKEEIAQQRKAMLSETGRPASNPFAQSQWHGPDPLVLPDDLRADRRFRSGLISAVFRAERATNNLASSAESSSCLKHPKKPLDVFLAARRKAENNARTYVRQPLSNPNAHAREVHKHHHRIAGINQELSLWLQGRDAVEAERRARRLILLGHRVNLTTFRAFWDESTFTHINEVDDFWEKSLLYPDGRWPGFVWPYWPKAKAPSREPS